MAYENNNDMFGFQNMNNISMSLSQMKRQQQDDELRGLQAQELRQNMADRQGLRSALAGVQPTITGSITDNRPQTPQQANQGMLGGLSALGQMPQQPQAPSPFPATQPDFQMRETTTPASPAQYERAALAYYAKTDPEKAAKFYEMITDKVSKMAGMGDPKVAVDYFNQVTGSTLEYQGAKDDYIQVKGADGKQYLFNWRTKEMKEFGEAAPQKKVERTVDLGDKVEYIYTDGTREIKPKGAAPGAGGRGGNYGKPPIGYRYTDNGDLEPIPGGPADQKVTAAGKAQEGAIQAIETAIGSANELLTHPGLKSATGKSSMTNLLAIPGGDAKTFLTKLDTFKSQMFVPMVQQLKGMGQLSDAEGKRLTAAIGALEPSMDEQSFVNSLTQIIDELQATRNRSARPISNATTGRVGVSSQPIVKKSATATGKPKTAADYLNKFK